MKHTPKSKKLLLSILAGVGITAGAAGIAGAVTTPSPSTPSVTVGASTTASTEAANANDPNGQNETVDATEVAGAPEAADATEVAGAPEVADGTEGAGAPEAADPAGADANEPKVAGSVAAPAEVKGATETDQAASLAPLAKITAADAVKAANAAVAGTASPAVLEDENGNVVFAVTIKTATGSVDVKVDAGNGKILSQDSGND